MTIKYKNRKEQIYYLHQGETKSGSTQYFFSLKDKGNLVNKLPKGYEIYENPNGRVFLRKLQQKKITDIELAIVEQGIKKLSKLKDYKIDVKGKYITINTPDQDMDNLQDIIDSMTYRGNKDAKQILSKYISYSPMLRFVLIDEEKRKYSVERFCFLGSIDDWIELGSPNSLDKLVKKYVKHLGEESFFELF